MSCLRNIHVVLQYLILLQKLLRASLVSFQNVLKKVDSQRIVYVCVSALGRWTKHPNTRSDDLVCVLCFIQCSYGAVLSMAVSSFTWNTSCGWSHCNTTALLYFLWCILESLILHVIVWYMISAAFTCSWLGNGIKAHQLDTKSRRLAQKCFTFC